MEAVKEQTLREYMQAGPLHTAEAVRIARQVADEVESAHGRGLVHPNLNPSNIILAYDEQGLRQIRVVGFSAAERGESIVDDEDDVSTAGLSSETARYMSPEQCAGSEPDARSNAYSLGIILYEMIAGRPPFTGPTATAIAGKHINEMPPQLSASRTGVLEPLSGLVTQMLRKNPVTRLPIAQFARTLRFLEYMTSSLSADSPERASITVPLTIPDLDSLHDARVTQPLSSPIKSSEVNAPPDLLADEDETTTLDGDAPRDGVSVAALSAVLEDERKSHTGTAGEASAEADAATVITARPRPEVAPVTESLSEPIVHSKVSVPLTQAAEGRGASSQRPRARRFSSPLLVVAGIALLALALAGIWFASRRPVTSEPGASGEAAETSPPTTDVTAPPPGQSATANQPNPAATNPTPGVRPTSPANTNGAGLQRGGGAAAETANVALRENLGGWITATNGRNLSKVMSYYMPKLDVFYRQRNVPASTVRAEKLRLFGQATSIRLQTGEPETTLSRDGRTATMRFRKQYVIVGGRQTRRGEVIQEIIWTKTQAGWKIRSERDVQVVR